MMPTDLRIRAACHEYLAEIFKLENDENKQREMIVNDVFDGDFTSYEKFKFVLEWAFDEVNGRYMAVLQYFCAKHRMMCSQIPAYMDFMPKLYNETEDLIADCSSHLNALNIETKTKDTTEYRILKDQLAEKDKQIQTLLALLKK